MRSSGAEDDRILRGLRHRLTEVLADALRGRRSAVLLDVPAYRNAGDLLIVRGTLEILHDLNVRVRWIQDWTLTSWHRLGGLRPNVAVLLLGGGNFGGLYPEHDDYRARVLGAIPDHSAAVVLPQSVHFPDPTAPGPTSVERARDLYGSFPRATYLVRDSVSAQALQDGVPQVAESVRLCPDAAFGATLSRRTEPQHDLFVLQRRDAESAGVDLVNAIHDLGVDYAHGDWPSFGLTLPAYRAQRKLMRVGGQLYGRAQRVAQPMQGALLQVLERGWQEPQRLITLAHVRDHVRIIEDTVAQGRVLLTDRLHAHVAASLMRVPNVALNNVDGKVGALVAEWTSELSTTGFAEDGFSARHQVQTLLAEPAL